MKKQNFFLVILLFMGNMILYAQCSVNAGGNATICGTSYTLQGSSSGSTSGTPAWTLVSKPSGAPDPVISNVNALTPNVTGMTSPGNYVFQVAQNCSPSGTVTSQVTITAPGDVSTFTAGADITNIPVTTGVATLNGVIPSGYTASWTYYNMYNQEKYNETTTTNATMSNTTTATPTLTLTKKANHDIDPAYRVVMRITSINNPSCWYEDDAVVRFVPNPQISILTPQSRCYPSTDTDRYIYLNTAGPLFATSTTNSSGNLAYGTTITVNTTSQPAGANVSFGKLENNILFLNGINTITGTYKFTVTVTNASGSYTTPEITFNNNGIQPNYVNFVDSAHPEQMMVYTSGGSGGAVYCNMVGSTNPITVYFKINPADPATTTTTVSNNGVVPPGGSPTLVINGSGTMDRNIIATPPTGGWRAGTYRFRINTVNGSCTTLQDYYIHISDGSRQNVSVANTTVCYPGSGVVSATIPLPAVYKGIVNSSYFQDFAGRYDFTVISKPAGSATPVYDATNLRTLTNTSTVISNLDKPGEYVFKIKEVIDGGGIDANFLNKEYACAGTSLEGTFSVFVSAQVGANAGSTQTLIGTSQTTFNANTPGVATGAWTLLTKPSGATDPVIATPSSNSTNVTGFNTPGIYTFRWTVTTGTCTSTSDLTVNVVPIAPGGVSGADFWVKSDDAGTIATAWKDNSDKADNIPNVGGITLSTADRNHNFYPYTTGYTAAKYFQNNNSLINGSAVTNPPSNYSLFSAVRPASLAAGRIMGLDDDNNAADPSISINASGQPNQYEYWNVNAAGTSGAAGTTSSNFSNPFSIGASNIFSATANNYTGFNGTSTIQGGEKRLGLNGTYENISGFATTNTFQLVSNHLRIGHSAFSTGTPAVAGAFPGDIMELVWYNRLLTTNEQSRVNTYLAIKNGVAAAEDYLTSANNTVWSITTNTGYNNNIFGLARDNTSALHQKQAASTSTGQKLVIGNGTSLFDSNAANTNTLTEMQFLIAGDNGLRQSLVTPLVYTAGSNGITNYRFESIWKTQNTGSVGTVTVAWPKGVKNLYLIQSSDAVFDGTDTFTPMTTEVTVNGIVYNIANVTLANGQFFTFTGLVQAPGGVLGPDFWVKSDDAGTIATAWKDNSANTDDIPNVGGITLSSADRNHNFYPYTTGYTSAKYFHNNTSLMNPLGNVELANTNTSIFSAVRPTSVTTGGRIIGIDNDAAYAAEPGVSITSAGKPRQYEYFNTTTSSDFSTLFNNGVSNIFSAIADNNTANGGTSTISGGEKRLGLNGSYESFSGFAAANKFQIYGTNLRLGYATWDVSGAFPGDIMEIAWYNRTLTANEQSRVNSYLAVKNGTTLNENYLATNSGVVWDRTTNTGYNNNIFGIARDEFTALYQKQAGSVNDAQKLVISTTGLADSNAANSTGLANDLQFLMAGDNGLKQNLTTPLSYTAGSNGITNYRFESIWKVQNTNSVGTVTIAWPKGVKNLYLVQSSDAVFDGADTFTPMTTEVTVNGLVYNVTNVTLTNGQFFTLAGFGNAPGGVANNLSYWYRADKNAVNTGAATDVTGWTDLWSGTTSAQLGTNALPKYVAGTSAYFNFNPGINFTVGTQTLGNNTVRTLTSLDYDVFTLTKEGLAAGGSNPRLFSVGMDNTTTGSANWDAFGIFPNTTGLERRVYGGGTQYPGVNPIFDATIPSIMYFKNSNTTSAKGLNGAAMNTAVTYTAVNAQYGGHIFGNTLFSSNGSDNAGFIGHIGETIVYGAGTLTTTERRKVDSYLAIKYGITLGQVNTDHYLDTAGNIVWNGAANTTYNNNIFGVTRDDIEAFEQKVSKSVNTSTILTTATINNFVVPNLDASRTGFANDKTYFLLGDNNVTATPLVNVTVAGSTLKRIQRAWLSQRKNTPNALYFEADLSAYGTTFATGNTIWMLVADDAAFTTNVKQVAGTYANGKWMFSNDFNADNVQRYITFAEGKAVCYKPGITTGTALDTKIGITALSRAGTGNSDNWPMVRKGGWLALESQTKAFVPNRVAFDTSGNPVGIAPANFVEGMMVYDTTNKCMKMYSLKEGEASMAWHCISTQTCPD